MNRPQERGSGTERSSASAPAPSLDGIVACVDTLAIEAMEAGNSAAALILAEAAGTLRRLRDTSGRPRLMS